MNSLTWLTNDSQTVRTQITLTTNLKKMIEEQAKKDKISLSEYLRQAAVLSLALEKRKKTDLLALADRVIGSVNLKNNPNWSSMARLKNWSRQIRKEWSDE